MRFVPSVVVANAGCPQRVFALLAFVASVLTASPTAAQPVPSPDTARAQLDRAERAWLDAYVENDREAMARFLADGFTITYPGGRVLTRDSVIATLTPEEGTDDAPVHYTENRTIRLYGRTAILRGIYVSPGGEEEPDRRARYTDTWMWIDGRWQVVASHLSAIRQ
jgi:hypothetical protein